LVSDANFINQEHTGKSLCSGFAVAAFLGVGLLLVQGSWFSSFSRTNVSTNTIIWNTDTLTVPLIAALLSWKLPSWQELAGGGMGFLGSCIAMHARQAGDTLLGCSLVFFASVGYALCTVLAIRNINPSMFSATDTIGIYGIVSTAVLVSFVAGGMVFVPAEIHTVWESLPPVQWLVFLACTSVCLNLGWLVSSTILGASWTATYACSTIPITLLVDFLAFGVQPSLWSLMGSTLVVAGIFLTMVGQLGLGKTKPGPEEGQAPLLEA